LVAEHNNVREFCDLSLKEQYGGVLGHYFLLSNKLVKLLKTARQNAGVGFIDTQYGLYRELNRDMSWIFTNRVDALSAYLQALLK
jgi:glycerophosphoryl diester phosphodiesterase